MIRFHTSSQAAFPVVPGYRDDIDASMGVALQEAHAQLDHHPSADPHALLCHMDAALRSQLHEHAQHGGSIALDNTWLHQQLVTLATGQGFPNLDRLALLPIYLRFRLMWCDISGHYADSLGKGGGTLVIGNEPISGSIHQGVARTLPADSKPLLAATWALVAQVMTISTSPQASIEEVQALGDRSQLVYEAWLAYALQASNIEPNRVLLRQIVNRFDTPRAIEAGKDAKAALYPRLAHEGYWLLAFANFISLKESILDRFEEENYVTDPDDWAPHPVTVAVTV